MVLRWKIMSSEDQTANEGKDSRSGLQKQIDELLSGKRQPKPSSLRDFIDQKMAEDKENQSPRDPDK